MNFKVCVRSFEKIPRGLQGRQMTDSANICHLIKLRPTSVTPPQSPIKGCRTPMDGKQVRLMAIDLSAVHADILDAARVLSPELVL